MYESFFGLSERPFMAAPRTDHYFPAPSAELARTTLLRVIARDEGPALLMGGSGLGKSLLAGVLCEQFEDRYAVANWGEGHLTTRHGLLQAILHSLGQPYRDMDEGELRLAMIDYLCRSDACPRGMLLVVDEAHRLPGRLLEELRLIGDMSRDGRPCVRLLLVGTMALEDRFTHPRLDAFSQRLAARCYLEPFTCPDTVEFLEHRMEVCGVAADNVFSDEALEAIHAAADGNPRAVSQLADHALVLAFQDNRHTIDEAYVQQVWADLQQLPVSWHGASGSASASASDSTSGEANGAISQGPSGGVIEFGSLDDEPAAVTAFSAPVAPLEDDAVSVESAAVNHETIAALPSTARDDVFGVDFVEEIDIVDRYVSLDTGGWSALPRVASREGVELARMLASARRAVAGDSINSKAADSKVADIEPTRTALRLQIAADTSPDEDDVLEGGVLEDDYLEDGLLEGDAAEACGVENVEANVAASTVERIVATADDTPIEREPLRLILVDDDDEETVDTPDTSGLAATLVRGAGLADAFHRLRRG